MVGIMPIRSRPINPRWEARAKSPSSSTERRISWTRLPNSSPNAVKVIRRGPRSNSTGSSDNSSSLIGVDFGAVNFDSYGATATAMGSEWGAPTWWLSSYSIDLNNGVTVLGLDENGNGAAWVKTYGGPTGTGFVYIGAQRHSIENLAGIQAMAEYGLIGERGAMDGRR